MDILKLMLSLLLPWMGAYFWLAAIESRLNPQPAHKLRQLGYAFLLGMAGVNGLLLAQSWLLGYISFGLPIGIIGLVSLSGGVAFIKSRRLAFQPHNGRPSTFYAVLFWVFAGWAAVHLALVAIEVLHRPVFPWDAWQTWMYRSKAWFYLGNVVPLDSAVAWEQGKATATYNTFGAAYPKFVSVIALWAATALGQWHEQLINFPTLFCGVALALAFYGHCREAELPRWSSALGVYLLVSIPLIGSHLALAGQADIWQTSFTGLGFVALLWGIVRGARWHKALGLMLIVLGIAVKNEGMVWFMVALALLAVTTRPRLSAIITLALVTMASLAWVSGIHYVDLPVIGGLGINNDRIYVPMIGNYRLMEFSLSDAYWANFYESSTWHLLWSMVVICILGLFAMPRGPLRHAVASLFLLLVATQLAIFSFTEQGLWAKNWTAINRLPMHMVPALIFGLLLSARELSSYREANKANKRTWAVPAVGLVLAVLIAGFYLASQYPATNGHSRSFDARQLAIVVGGGQIIGNAGVVTRFDGGIAVLSSGGVHINADQAKILKLDTGGENRLERRFFWRNGPGEEDLHSIDTGAPGEKTINLDVSPNWTGTVTEIGLLFHEDEDRKVEVRSLKICTRTLLDMLSLTLQDWTTMSHWSQKSINYVSAGSESSPIKLPLLMAGWLLITALLAGLLRQVNTSPFTSIIICAISAWLILDLRWSINIIQQADDTRRYYSTHRNVHLDIAQDHELLEFTEQAANFIGGSNKPVLIVNEREYLNLQALRTKYHLLPIPAHVRKDSTIDTMPKILADNVIIVRSLILAPGETPLVAETAARQVSSRLNRVYTVVLDTENGILLAAKLN
ncbi:hypothetical protein GPB2148_2532 [marine gamma proteobacterium HTCC2148]|nr:hypothetical protein GPB2148_2532 [marine gamma proteobacterium HTCC2148]